MGDNTKGHRCTEEEGATTPQNLRCPVTQQLRTTFSVTRGESERHTHLARSTQIHHAHLCLTEGPPHTSVMRFEDNLAEENCVAELP